MRFAKVAAPIALILFSSVAMAFISASDAEARRGGRVIRAIAAGNAAANRRSQEPSPAETPDAPATEDETATESTPSAAAGPARALSATPGTPNERLAPRMTPAQRAAAAAERAKAALAAESGAGGAGTIKVNALQCIAGCYGADGRRIQ